jgi:hypothetical protein
LLNKASLEPVLAATSVAQRTSLYSAITYRHCIFLPESRAGSFLPEEICYHPKRLNLDHNRDHDGVGDDTDARLPPIFVRVTNSPFPFAVCCVFSFPETTSVW